jgi:two-component system OmpR family sensor kinase/two-component system sensor histidine kinase BaeS
LEVLRRALRRLVLTEGVVVLLGLVVGAILSRRITRPVTKVAEAAGRIAAGDLSTRVPEDASGELGDLARSFNQMAAALERADQLRRNMTADVAHDLRTPLSVIRGKLEGIVDGIYPATEDHIRPVLEETEVLTQLVEDLRLLALAEARQLTLDRRPMDVAGLLRDAQVNFTPLAQDRGITLVLDLPEALPRVVADRRRIAQVLGNLIVNALRYTPSGGTVTLSARADDGAVTVAVRDTGIGMPPEELPYVFERFWRGEKSRSRDSGGSGLGLAIARELVVLHDGEISVESAPGRGTTFRFTLPTRL